MIRIKNWDTLQHFKDRKPIWIKLYRGLLDDPEWAALSPLGNRVLIMLWLLASESNGELPPTPVIAFRLRMSEKLILSTISELHHWLIFPVSERYQDDIKPISSRYQVVISETETETETETEIDRIREDHHLRLTKTKTGEPVALRPTAFDEIWEAYPRKVGKQEARKAFTKLNGTGPETSVILAAILHQKSTTDWTKDGGQFIPHLSSWLNQARWADESPALPTTPAGSIYPEGFEIDDRGIALATSWGLNPHAELAAFRDHHTAKGTVFQCWHAAYRQWLRNAVKYAKRSGGTHAVS